MPKQIRRCASELSILLISATLTAPATAATFCADDTAELVFALASASQSAEGDEVRVRIGTFTLSSNISLTFNGAFAISGGWSPSCLLQSNDPAASVITSSTPGSFAVELRPRDGDLSVERLTFDQIDGLHRVPVHRPVFQGV